MVSQIKETTPQGSLSVLRREKPSQGPLSLLMGRTSQGLLISLLGREQPLKAPYLDIEASHGYKTQRTFKRLHQLLVLAENLQVHNIQRTFKR